VVSTPRISIGPAGCRINRDYAWREPEAGLGTYQDERTRTDTDLDLQPQIAPDCPKSSRSKPCPKCSRSRRVGDEIVSIRFGKPKNHDCPEDTGKKNYKVVIFTTGEGK